MKDNEVKIGRNKIGPDTIIQVNLKTLIVFLGIVLSGLTTAWVNINKNIKESGEKASKETEEVAKDIKEIKDQDLKELSRKIYAIDGKVEVIYYQRNQNLPIERSYEKDAENIKPNVPKSQ